MSKFANEIWKSDMDCFKEATEKFYNKELSAKDYKGISGGYGSYAQRGGETSMIRLRMVGGRITKEKLRFLVESIEKHKVNKVHFTTCQTVQYHNLKPATLYKIMEQALNYGIVTRGGGGDFPRNVMASPLSGVEQGEYFDVMPYVEEASDYLMAFIKTVKLPRKLKVGFSNSDKNIPHATFRDLGFVAREDGTFDVYSAGGLGNNPKMGLKVAEAVEPSKVLYYIKAMVKMFVAYGNYENRGKARTRYMQDTLGVDGYIQAYQKKLEEVMKEETNLDLDVVPTCITKQPDGVVVSGKRIIPQKQEGLYSVFYHPIGGTPDPGKLRKIYEVIKDMDQVELRLSPDESVYIINCNGKEAQKVLKATADGAETIFEASVSCIGASVCQVGVRDSQGLMEQLVAMSREQKFADGILPKVHISGCPSSCGTHQIGRIGFHGCVKVIDKVPNPAFTLHINGYEEQGKERFAEKLGVILEKDIPEFLCTVGKTVELAGVTYEEWIQDHEATLKEIAEKYLV